jgi:hypothetical protein
MSEVRQRKVSDEKLSALPILGEQPKNEKEEKHLREICEYEFYNLEEPGTEHRFPYGNTRNQTTFTMYHGEKYKVPRCVARHLESKGTPIYKWQPDGTGSLTKKLVGKKPRFRMSQSFNG